MKSVITEFSLTTSAQLDYKNPEGKNSTLGTAYAWWNRATRRTNDNVTTKTQSTFHTAHMNLNRWIDARVIPCGHSPVVRLRSSSSVLHIVSQVVRVSHVIHACSERHSSTLTSSSHSPPISCSPSCSSSTTLRTVVTLRIPPKRRWGLLTSPTSPHFPPRAPVLPTRLSAWYFLSFWTDIAFFRSCLCSQRDSLTRWRLALAQEAARVASSSSSHLFFWTTMCLASSGNMRGISFSLMWTYEVLSSS